MLAFLLSICDEDDRDRVEYLYYTYHDKMVRFAKKRLIKFKQYHCLQDAEDIVQEAYVNILKYAHRINYEVAPSMLECYILTIVANQVINFLNLKNKCPVKYIEDIEELIYDEGAEASFERIEVKEDYSRILSEIKFMDEKYSAPLLMHYCADLSAQEIADVLHIPVKTVYTRLARGIDKVKKVIETESNYGSDRK